MDLEKGVFSPALVANSCKVLEDDQFASGTRSSGACAVAAARLRQVQKAPGAGQRHALGAVGEGRRGGQDHGATLARPSAVLAVARARLWPKRVQPLAPALGRRRSLRDELVARGAGARRAQRVAALGLVVELRQVGTAAAAQRTRQHQLAAAARTA